MKRLEDFEVRGKRVLVRCDFNVSLDETGRVQDDFKIKKTLPTIQYLVDHGAKIILMSHLDELENGHLPTMNSVGEVLSQLLKLPVKKMDDCVGTAVENAVLHLADSEIVLLENVRMQAGEKNNDPDFAKALAKLGEIFINDAFAVCHRVHASVVGVPSLLPHGAGLLLQEEVIHLDKILQNPARPLVVLVGGAKVKTKETFIENISHRADLVLLGGLLQKEILQENIHFTYPEKILAPMDHLEEQDLDEKTVALFVEKIQSAKTILWNGPFGYIHDEKFAKGTRAIIKAIAVSQAFSVAGGGQTVEFLQKEGMLEAFSYVSTAGGAMLDYLSDGQLPGLEALQ